MFRFLSTEVLVHTQLEHFIGGLVAEARAAGVGCVDHRQAVGRYREQRVLAIFLHHVGFTGRRRTGLFAQRLIWRAHYMLDIGRACLGGQRVFVRRLEQQRCVRIAAWQGAERAQAGVGFSFGTELVAMLLESLLHGLARRGNQAPWRCVQFTNRGFGLGRHGAEGDVHRLVLGHRAAGVKALAGRCVEVEVGFGNGRVLLLGADGVDQLLGCLPVVVCYHVGRQRFLLGGNGHCRNDLLELVRHLGTEARAKGRYVGGHACCKRSYLGCGPGFCRAEAIQRAIRNTREHRRACDDAGQFEPKIHITAL